jgi:hypothetical protein
VIELCRKYGGAAEPASAQAVRAIRGDRSRGTLASASAALEDDIGAYRFRQPSFSPAITLGFSAIRRDPA